MTHPTARPRRRKRTLVGLNKSHDAAVCLMSARGPLEETQIILKERATRAKHAHGSLDRLLFKTVRNLRIDNGDIAENFPLLHPRIIERAWWNRVSPYFETHKNLGLSAFIGEFNPRLRFFTHHYCHARAAAAISPYKRALIIVNDGGGNTWQDFDPNHPERTLPPPPALSSSAREFCSVYRHDGSKLECLQKKWQPADATVRLPGIGSVQSLGRLFVKASLYIFNSPWNQGKVMGLAAFGRPGALSIPDRDAFFKNLGEIRRFRGAGKRAWEDCGHFAHYADVAAAVQDCFERWLLDFAADMKRRFPKEENLILTGGCALNCVANMKLAETGLFSSVYVPPFPGDESIAFGAACALRYENPRMSWRPMPWTRQIPNLGPADSVPEDNACRREFTGWTMRRVADPARTAADLLAQGKIVAWFQGRSESGPRALGFRSILANPLRPGIKDRLNARVKGRESFRPYGCSVPWEDSSRYFEVPAGFESPFMSFAPRVRSEHRLLLREITHKDGTSRIQTVHKSQNPLLYACLKSFEKKTKLGCVLNTSLNVMGEPIVETLGDLRRFLEKTPVDAAVAGRWLIKSQFRGSAHS